MANPASDPPRDRSMEEVPCNLCGSTEYAVVYPRIEAEESKPLEQKYSAAQGELCTEQVVRCARCGLVFINPRDSGALIEDACAGGEDPVYVSQSTGRLVTFEKGLRWLEKTVPRGRLLDVGAAAGYFVRVARDAGWDAVGIEPNRWLAEYGRREFGVDVRTGTLDTAELEPASFDLVTFWDVIEHTLDPSRQIELAARALKPGGYVMLCIPDFGSVWAKIFGRKWWFLLSHHLYYFDRRTMAAMLEQHGLRVVQNKMHFQSVNFGHLVHMTHLYSRLVHSLASPVTRALRLDGLPVSYYASQLRVLARKESVPK